MFKNRKILSQVMLISLITATCLSFNTKHALAVTNTVTKFAYTGNVQTFTAPYTGDYQIQAWGASSGTTGGKGGYAKGTIPLTANQTIYIYVGGSNGYNQSSGGGGNSGGGTVGGGGTDVRVSGTALSNRVIVAGGGGGGTLYSIGSRIDGQGGSGGGLTGLQGQTVTVSGYTGYGGAGGTAGGNKGGNGVCVSPPISNGIGFSGGGGGSSYLGSLKNASTIAGNTSMTSPTGSSETGHVGDGYVSITQLFTPNISSKTTTVIGTFNATTIDVSVPAVNSFTFNPNTNEFNVQNIQINNNSSAPVYAKVNGISISPTSEWTPTLVAPATYTDTQWNNLSQADTKSKVALGFSVNNSSNWLNGIQNQNVWSTDLINGTKIGAIRTTSSVNVTPTLKVGRAITNEKTLTSNYVFEFGLE